MSLPPENFNTKHTPDFWALNNTPWQWQVFGHLTHHDRRFSWHENKKRFRAILRDVASRCGVPFKQLLACLRLEHGGIVGRPHFHFLLAGLPQSAVTIDMCGYICARWAQKTGGAISRVAVFDACKNGVGYLTKSPWIFSPYEDDYWYSDAIFEALRSDSR